MAALMALHISMLAHWCLQTALQMLKTGGWIETTFYDPLPRLDSFNGAVGSYDSVNFDQTTDSTIGRSISSMAD
jgi:hypothetical protein